MPWVNPQLGDLLDITSDSQRREISNFRLRMKEYHHQMGLVPSSGISAAEWDVVTRGGLADCSGAAVREAIVSSSLPALILQSP